jgi:hypothetical protein
MKDAIAVLNAGSSSLKFSVFDVAGGALELCVRGQAEALSTSPRFAAKDASGVVLDEKAWGEGATVGHAGALDHLVAFLRRRLSDRRLTGIGHRVVHGGPEFAAPLRVDRGVLDALDKYVPLAPLHQPHNLAPIRLLAERLPQVPQVACFDTAFHRRQPPVAQAFALPKAITDRGVLRYGFHGLSYEYVAGALSSVDAKAAAGKTVVLHLGNGSSMCAIDAGQSVASTMGFTAVDGLPMGTRCGSLDPGVVLWLMDEMKMDARAIEKLVYQQSGPARRVGRVERHAHARGERRARREGGDRPVRLPDRPRARLARRGARRPRRDRVHGGHRREQAAWSASACAATRRGSASSSTPTRTAGTRRACPRGEPHGRLRDPHQRRADDREPHAPRARVRAREGTSHDRAGQEPGAEGREGARRRHRQRPVDRLRLREGVPRARRRPRGHLPQRQGEALRRAAREGARGRAARPAGRLGRRAARGAFDAVGKAWGSLDILVHSIAFAPKEDLQGTLLDCSASGFAKAMDVSCHSFVRMARLAAPLMRDGGTMLAMSYHGAQKVVPTYSVMGPVKAALEACCRYLAYELGPRASACTRSRRGRSRRARRRGSRTSTSC